MAKKIFYEKQGRKYVPVSEYDNDLLDSFQKGNHLVMIYPGGTSRRFNIDPNYAAMIAAGRVAEDAISVVIRNATDLRPTKSPITPGQQAAWEKLSKEFGEEIHMLQWPSAREACEEAVKAMQLEADKLMKNDSVRKAYDHFVLMCKLTQESNNV
jgi:hypothetical protein